MLGCKGGGTFAVSLSSLVKLPANKNITISCPEGARTAEPTQQLPSQAGLCSAADGGKVPTSVLHMQRKPRGGVDFVYPTGCNGVNREQDSARKGVHLCVHAVLPELCLSPWPSSSLWEQPMPLTCCLVRRSLRRLGCRASALSA